MVLKYIYTGELELKKYPGEIILGLLVASDELLLGELFEHVQDYLVKKQTTWVQENFVLVLHTVFKLASCKRLQNYCLESICADPRPFITSENFSSLDKDILYGLLERNDLQIEEIVVWDSLIKWGIEQTPGLGILFLLSEIEEYYFKGTLPMTTTLPPRSGIIQKIESNIIKPRLSSIIINWIERKDSYYNRKKKDKAYNLNLIYRKSRDVTTDIKNMKISRVINSSYAICNTGNGVNFGGTDLNLENDYLSLSYSGNYENLDINLERNRNESLMDMDYLYGNLYDGINRHEVEEIEFFRVMKIK
ncbi:unnamed protein product [Rhizophagus irregularis]|nr:unnamed protein product [Rhizophagus irregularis]